MTLKPDNFKLIGRYGTFQIGLKNTRGVDKSLKEMAISKDVGKELEHSIIEV